VLDRVGLDATFYVSWQRVLPKRKNPPCRLCSRMFFMDNQTRLQYGKHSDFGENLESFQPDILSRFTFFFHSGGHFLQNNRIRNIL